MRTLSDWTDLEDMAKIAKNLSLQLTIGQEHNIKRSLKPPAKSTILFIQNNCALLMERIQSGHTLTLEESHALLDAHELLSYMKDNNKPNNANISDCVKILLQVIMGEDYVHDSEHISNTKQQSNITYATQSAQSQQLHHQPTL